MRNLYKGWPAVKITAAKLKKLYPPQAYYRVHVKGTFKKRGFQLVPLKGIPVDGGTFSMLGNEETIQLIPNIKTRGISAGREFLGDWCTEW